MWSDVDVQALGPLEALRAAVDAAPAADLCCQRELHDAGLNVGFLVARPSPRLRGFLGAWRDEVLRTGAARRRFGRRRLSVEASTAARRGALSAGNRSTRHRRPPALSGALDQKILNRVFLRRAADVRVARLPGAFWASSNGAPPPLEALVLHHANFVLDADRRPSTDPSPKLEQLDAVARLRAAGDEGGWAALLGRVRGDASLGRYRARHFDRDRALWEAAVD